MIVKWRLFAAAALVGGYLLISQGIPVIPVLVGCGLAALLTWRLSSRATAQSR